MKVLKPVWVSHGSFAIYSVDIHPDGTRFASGGGDNKIRIWAMGPLNNEEDDHNVEFPKQLAVIRNHTQPVNGVRWSNDGMYLASCGDDGCVMLAQCVTSTGGFSGDNLGDEPNHEQWRVFTYNKGHDSTVNDVAWAPDNTKLASCSTDNTVIVWDVPKLTKIAVLKEHHNFVVGLCWDPLGKYIASQSNDQSMILWSCNDWKMEHKVEEPFRGTTSPTFFRRPSWSPDGSLVCAAHGRNGKQPTAVVITRDKWTTSADFVGHSLPVAVVRFNPCIFQENGGIISLKCTVGSQDGSFSVWSTASPRPIVRVHSIFEQTIHDAAWTKNGRGLLVCSADGTVAYCIFDHLELGVPLSPQDHKAHLKKLYGNAMIAQNINIVEDPVFINPPKAATPARNIKSTVIPVDVKAKQIEGRTQSGQRRITPVLVEAKSTFPSPFYLPSDTSPSPAAEPTNGTNGTNGTHTQAQNTTSEVAAAMAVPTASTSTPSVNPSVKLVNMSSSISATTVIAPPQSTVPATTLASAHLKTSSLNSTPATQTPASNEPPPSAPTGPAQPTSPQPKVPSAPVPAKRKEPDQPDAVKKPKKKPDGEKEKDKEKEKEKEKKAKKQKTNAPGSTATAPASDNEKEVSPPVLPMLTPASLPSSGILACMLGPQGKDGSVEVRAEGEKHAAIRCLFTKSSSRTEWETRILGRAVVLAANSNFVSVGCEDEIEDAFDIYVNIFSSAGRLMFPPLALTSPLAFLEASSSDHLMAITTDGYLTVWNVSRAYKEVNAQQLPLSLIIQHSSRNSNSHLNLSHAWLGESGQPVVMSGHMAFAYHLQMGVWMCVGNGTDPITHSTGSSSIAPSLLGKISNAVQNNRPSVVSAISGPEGDSVAAIEAALAAAQILGSAGEYKHWLQGYTRKLVEHADVSRLQELCNSLLGPPSSNSLRISNHININNNNTATNQFGGVWEPTINGIPKRELLRDILPIMSTNRSLQRLVTQFREMLEVMASDSRNI